MKSRGRLWGIVGPIISEGILFIEIGIDLYTGEMTCIELILELAFCLLLAGVISSLIMRRVRKDRSSSRSD